MIWYRCYEDLVLGHSGLLVLGLLPGLVLVSRSGREYEPGVVAAVVTEVVAWAGVGLSY